jgi:single-strand DNA-binding protein
MANLNRVFLVGNLTRDPEVRYTPTGTAVSDLGLAVNDTFKTKTGETKETTTFVDIVVWGRQAETCGEYLSKGSPVLIEGRLQLEQWQTENGEKRSRLRVHADRVQFLGRPKKSGEVGDAPPPEKKSVKETSPVSTMGESAPPPVTEGADSEDLPF